MAQKTQRILGGAIFAGAILFGMHVDGQVPSGPPMLAPSSITPPNAAQAPTTAPATAAAQAPTQSANGAPPPRPAGNQQNSNQGQTAGQPQAQQQPNALPGVPAFGAGAARAADAILNTDGARRSSTPAPAFVPSEVETIVPTRFKVGDPRAILHTSLGDMTVRLFPAFAPKTVRNFIDLARGDKEFYDVKTGRSVRRPFYTNLVFHRVVADYLAQTGCPFGNGRGGPGYNIPDEISSALHFEKAGMLAMAPERKDGAPAKDTNGSQFFISLGAMPDWDGKYTIFGEVERGLNVLQKIGRSKTGPTDRPIKRIFLYGVEIFDDTTTNALKSTKAEGEK